MFGSMKFKISYDFLLSDELKLYQKLINRFVIRKSVEQQSTCTSRLVIT